MTGPEEHTGAAGDGGRMASADVGAALERFGDAGLLAAGKINLIALDAIVERLGARWAARRDHIHDYVDRAIQRGVGPHGYHLRISDTDFLICQPELGRFSGQAVCLQILRDVLLHFIGDAAWADEGVHQVTRIGATEVRASRVRPDEVEQGRQRELRAGVPAGPRRAIDDWSPFVATDGRELSVTCSLEPVVALKTFARIGLRLVRRVVVTGSGERLTAAMVRGLSRSDILRIDLATVAWGIDQLRAPGGGGGQPSLIVPVSFTSLSSQGGRTRIARLLMEARCLVKQGVICEIGDVEGAPHGTMLQVVSLIRPFCLYVVARIDATHGLSQLTDTGLQGLAVECPRELGDDAWVCWARTAIRATRRVVRSTLLYRVASRRHAALAAELGATHASFRG